jgi:solute:Na+ symporter, SSS family
MFGIPRGQVLLYVGLALLITAVYSAVSGLWGVALTDAFQFVLAMAGTIVLAVVVLGLPQIGGLSGLRAQLPEWTLRFTPAIGETSAVEVAGAFALSLSAFLAYVGVQWWASWYPGAEPGGGGYIAQRMMSAKDEKHSLLATLWFQVAHYCVRPWPWIIVGLASLVLYPELGPAEKRLGYVFAMRDHLPTGLRGMLVASFFAAYMSTIATQLNWGTSYVMNDFYRRFVNPQAGERELVRLSRVMTLVLMVVSLLVTSVLETISGAWAFIIEAGAGLGLVLILRWYWWRINAWSEIAAMLTPLVVYGYLRAFTSVAFPQTLYVIVGVTTVAWLAVTYLTPPTDFATLQGFFRRVHPGGPGWAPVARTMPDVQPDTGLGRLTVDWLAGVVLVYCTLFAVGKLLFGTCTEGLLYLAAAVAAGAVIMRHLSRRGFGMLVE